MLRVWHGGWRAGRSGVVLSGGGARAFAHLGVLEVLLGAGLTVDRVGGVSMGAFWAVCSPAGWTAPLWTPAVMRSGSGATRSTTTPCPAASLIRGHKAEAMLERVFGDVLLEELARSFYCASVDLRGNRLVIDRDGPMMDAVGASMSCR